MDPPASFSPTPVPPVAPEARVVLVVGSCNFDLTIRTERLPGPSETILGGEYLSSPGGKGANQAVGLARLGSKVLFLSRVGRDHYGTLVYSHLAEQGIDLAHVSIDDASPTGLALITLDGLDTRTIVVSPGANQCITSGHVDDFLRNAPAGAVLLTQLEIPVPTVSHLLRAAKRRSLRTVLHASPAVAFPHDLLRLVDVLVLNQTELQLLSRHSAQHLETAQDAAELLLSDGAGTVLVTMGPRGVLVARRKDAWPGVAAGCLPRFVPGFKVREKESQVASSTFIAGLVHDLARRDGKDLLSSVRFGLAAMAVSLGRSRGETTLPSLAEVDSLLGSDAAEAARPREEGPLRDLADRASSIRRRIIRMLSTARSGHPGGSLSVVEILAALYFHAMVYDPREPAWPGRDRLVLSKGHAAPALYSALIEAGILDAKLETELRRFGSVLQGHPDRKRCPGVEISTGSLGQGLSAANGMALAARRTGAGYRVFCILGDGEVQEGQVWEAAMTAGHYGLDNLCAIIDYNALQIDGNIGQIKSPIEPLSDKWKAFGWGVQNVDGHDLGELCAAFDRARGIRGQPQMLIAHTVKGRGVSFMEGVIEYHGSTLSEEEVRRALFELEADR